MSDNLSKREILRKKRQEQKRRTILTFILIAAAVIVLVLVAIFLPKYLTENASDTATPGFSIGDPDAPLTVVEFSSYTCSHCYTFNEETSKDFIRDYVDTGMVYFTYINYPSNSEGSMRAAEASYCAADQGKFYDYKDQVFGNFAVADSFSEDNLVAYADAAGLDVGDFENCMASGKFADAYIQDVQFAQQSGVSATPTFLINGEQLVTSSELLDTVDSYLIN
ncbi:DsbA family protein [bacterium]|nr:DsbA family protein [bacterium]